MRTSLHFVDTYEYAGSDLRMDVPTVLGFARHQRHFGPGQLLVLAATRTARILSLSHCVLDDCPDCVLAACLQLIKDEEPALITAIGDRSSGWLDTCPTAASKRPTTRPRRSGPNSSTGSTATRRASRASASSAAAGTATSTS